MEKRFFHTISTKEFLDIILKFSHIDKREEINPVKAMGRIMARDVISPENFPPFSRSAMDGYAICARDSFGASNENPAYLKIVGEIKIDETPSFSLSPGECAKVYTGSPLPQGCDAVIMLEYTEEISPDEVEIRKSCAPWENIIVQGEDARTGEVLLSKGVRIRPQEIGILCEVGINRIEVFQKIKVGIISTGDELVPPNTPSLEYGKIRDVNTYALSSMVKALDAIPIPYGIIKDREEDLIEAIKRGVEECNVLLISGGSSVGVADLTEKAILSFNKSKILCHGVSISPGKPTILSSIDSTPVVGLPGQVTSAQVVMHILISPLIRHISGDATPLSIRYYPMTEATLIENIPSKQGREDYVRVRIEKKGERTFASPIFAKSGLLKSLLLADGLIKIPANKEGILKGSQVRVLLL